DRAFLGELREGRASGDPLPLRRTEVEALLAGPLARVRFSHHFQNDRDHAVEVVYALPLSLQDAISDLCLRVGERRVRGVVREREEARATYNGARRAGARGALLEQERPDLFTLSLTHVAPGEEVIVEIALDELLCFVDGAWRLAIPLAQVPGPHRLEA